MEIGNNELQSGDVGVNYNNYGEITHSLLVNPILGINFAYHKNGIGPGPLNFGTITLNNLLFNSKYYRKKTK